MLDQHTYADDETKHRMIFERGRSDQASLKIRIFFIFSAPGPDPEGGEYRKWI